MSRAARITEDRLIDEAIAIIDRDGLGELTVGTLADALGIRAPSLYNHVAGIDDIRRQVAITAVNRLGDVLTDAAMGRRGEDALFALCHAYRTFALRNPDLYTLTVAPAPGRDDVFDQHAWRALRPLYAVLAACGFEEAEAIHTSRLIRASLHGFVTLELAGTFGLPESVDESFDQLVGWIAGLVED
jgi:AcrR family transcriptional regulator